MRKDLSPTKTKLAYIVFSFSLMVITASFQSCDNNSSNPSSLKQEITKRLEILNSSFKFQIISMNLEGNVFEGLVTQVGSLSEANSKKDLQEYYSSIRESLSKYKISISENPKTKYDFLFNTLMGLDSLIFKYIPSRINVSDYKMIVVPNTTHLNVGDTLKAKIYLTVSDTLYEPEFIYGDYHLPSESGVGQYNYIAGKTGKRLVEGKAVFYNEYGSKDTLNYRYEFAVK